MHTPRKSPLGYLMIAASLAAAATPASPADGSWSLADPDEAGFAPDLAGRIETALAGDDMDNLHAVVVVRDGRLVYETYLSGDDQKLGWPRQGVVFGPEKKHDLRSVSKSVVGLLYGVALSEGKVPPLDAPLLDAFPEYADLATDRRRASITIGDALTMTVGTDWSEDGPRPTSEDEMELASDPFRFALDQPMATEPGSTFVYNSGATNLLARIIARGVGTPVDDYARARLFAPLGIEDVEWVTDYEGTPWAHAGLRLRPRDVAKIGQLVLAGGAWNGAQVVPEDWLDASFQGGVAAMEGCEYGFQWWLCATEAGLAVREASGNGGQELLIVPDLDLVMVTTRGNYGDPDAWRAPWTLLETVIAAADAR